MKIPSTVRFVLFDAVGTLIEAAPPVAEVYAQVGQRYGSRRTVDDIRQRFRAALEASQRAHGLDEHHERERWRTIVRAVLDDADHTDERPFRELWEHFALAASWRVFDDVAPAWQAIEASGRTIGIASNFDGRLRGITAAFEPLRHAAQCFISSEVGFAKPDARFFQFVQALLQARPDQIMLVGDDHVADLAAAKAVGWHAILIDRDTSAAAHSAIRRLTDLTQDESACAPPCG